MVRENTPSHHKHHKQLLKLKGNIPVQLRLIFFCEFWSSDKENLGSRTQREKVEGPLHAESPQRMQKGKIIRTFY